MPGSVAAQDVVFDSHVHFLDPSRSEGLDWPAPDSPLYRVALPADRAQAVAGYKLLGCVAVETSRRSIDDQWLLDLAERDPLIAGAVLNLQPDLQEFSTRFELAMKSDFFVGIRLRPIEHYKLSDTTLLKSLGLLERQRKCIEFGAKTPASKAMFAELAQEFSATTWILDHCGHPRFDGPADKSWLADMQGIAELPNVVTKVTGCEGDVKAWQPTLHALADMFGKQRLLYGSNWPVSMENTVPALAAFFGDAAPAFFSDNARRAYRIRRS